jgi:hypothetical protein
MGEQTVVIGRAERKTVAEAGARYRRSAPP